MRGYGQQSMESKIQKVCALGLLSTIVTAQLPIIAAPAAKPAVKRGGKPAAKPAASKTKAAPATPAKGAAATANKTDAKSAELAKPTSKEPPFDDWVGQTEGIPAGSLGQPVIAASMLIDDPDAKDVVAVQWLFVVVSVICMCLAATLLLSLPPRKKTDAQ